MPYEDRKIEEAESYEEKAPFSVRKYHIDTNEHAQLSVCSDGAGSKPEGHLSQSGPG